jgi:hypothetical protein
MAEAYETQLRDPQVQSLSFDERLGLLADQEWSRRQSRRLARRLQDAKLPLAATIEDIDYSTPRRLDRALIRTLADGRWLQEHQSTLITGRGWQGLPRECIGQRCLPPGLYGAVLSHLAAAGRAWDRQGGLLLSPVARPARQDGCCWTSGAWSRCPSPMAGVVDDRQETRKSEPGRRKVQFFVDRRIMFRDSSQAAETVAILGSCRPQAHR